MPQDNLIKKSILNGQQVAEELFGKANMKENLTEMIAGSPLTLFCKDSIRKELSGDFIDGFNFAFCNRSKSVQTDVGVCIATDPIQYLENGKIFATESISQIEEGLKDIEHVIVLLVDKIGLVNNPPNYKVCFV